MMKENQYEIPVLDTRGQAATASGITLQTQHFVMTPVRTVVDEPTPGNSFYN